MLASLFGPSAESDAGQGRAGGQGERGGAPADHGGGVGGGDFWGPSLGGPSNTFTLSRTSEEPRSAPWSARSPQWSARSPRGVDFPLDGDVTTPGRGQATNAWSQQRGLRGPSPRGTGLPAWASASDHSLGTSYDTYEGAALTGARRAQPLPTPLGTPFSSPGRGHGLIGPGAPEWIGPVSRQRSPSAPGLSSQPSLDGSPAWSGYLPRFPRGSTGLGAPIDGQPGLHVQGTSTTLQSNPPRSCFTRVLARMMACIAYWLGGEMIFDWNKDGRFDEHDVAQFMDWVARAGHIQLFTPRLAKGKHKKGSTSEGQQPSFMAEVGSSVHGPAEEDEIAANLKFSKPWCVILLVLIYNAFWVYWAWYQMAYEDKFSATRYTDEMTMAHQFPDDGNTYSFLNGEKAQVDYCEWVCNDYESCVGIYFRHHVVTECVLLASFPAEECSSGCGSEFDSRIYAKVDTTITSFMSKPGGLENNFPGQTTLRIHGDFCEGYSKQAYRLFSYQFTHGSMNHVLSNSFAILFFGAPLELLSGSLWLFLLFQAGVLGGGLCTWLTSAHTNTVGASGGSYALIGMQIGNMVLNWRQKRFRMPLAAFFFIFLAADMFNFTYTKSSTTSYSTHAGGLITGLLAQLVLGRKLVYSRRGVVMRGFAIFTLFGLGVLSCGWYLVNPFPAARGVSELFYDPGFIGPWCWVAQACIYPGYATDGSCPSAWQCVGCQTRKCVEDWYAFAASSSDPPVYLVQTTWQTCRDMAKLLVGPPAT